ncbi:MAG: hypothetical protein ACOVT5_11275, partial [Armatimonadaceae bacterium]
DSAGKVVDLRSLGQMGLRTQKYVYLGTWELDEKDYKYLRVTFDPQMMAMAHGGNGDGNLLAVDSSIPRDGNGRAFITTQLTQVKRFGEEADDVVVDFDLSKFAVAHGKVVPSVAEGNQEGLTNAGYHDQYDYSGEVNGLTGSTGNQMFHLKNGDWNGLVIVDNNTIMLKRESGAGTTTLANQQRVEVHGIFDPVTRRIRAQEIKVETPGSDAQYRHEIRGLTVGREETGDYRIRVVQAEGFIPEHREALVKLAEGAILQGPDGLAISSAVFQATASDEDYELDVEGSYDATTNTLVARRARLIVLKNDN